MPVTRTEGSPALRKLLLVPVVALVAVAAVVVPTAAATSTANTVTISASKTGLAYDQKIVKAKAGKLTLVFKNPSMLPHNVVIEAAQGEKRFGNTKTITNSTTSVVLNLKKGTYHFYCSVPGHEDAGMSGKLVVS